MTDKERAYLQDAREAIEAVSTEADLVNWDAAYTCCDDYLHLSDDGIREIEEMRSPVLRRLYGVDW